MLLDACRPEIILNQIMIQKYEGVQAVEVIKIHFLIVVFRLV